jgi:hypothetical protein
MASRANPGNSSHCRPSTKKSSNAVTKSATHPIGGSGVVKAPTTSEMPAIPKAKTSCLFENLRAFDDGVSALVGFLGSGGGGFIVVSLLAELRGLPDGLCPDALFRRGRYLSAPLFSDCSILPYLYGSKCTEHRKSTKTIQSHFNSKETNLQRL